MLSRGQRYLSRSQKTRARRHEKKANDKRPNREELSRRAGPWPGSDDAVWLAKKGRLLIKRTGQLGIGSQYSVVGTWSAEPEDPVDTVNYIDKFIIDV